MSVTACPCKAKGKSKGKASGSLGDPFIREHLPCKREIQKTHDGDRQKSNSMWFVEEVQRDVVNWAFVDRIEMVIRVGPNTTCA